MLGAVLAQDLTATLIQTAEMRWHFRISFTREPACQTLFCFFTCRKLSQVKNKSQHIKTLSTFPHHQCCDKTHKAEETASISSSKPTSATIYNAYTSIIKKIELCIFDFGF